MKWIRKILGAGLLILASASISVATAEQDPRCEGLSGAAFGLCTAAISVGCDDEETRKPGCTKIEDKYEQITGGVPPWTIPFLCRPTGESCGGIAAIPCADGSFCADEPGDACTPGQGGVDCGGICIIGTLNDCPRHATVSPLSQYFARFEGLAPYFNPELNNVCASDADAIVSGCSDEVCASEYTDLTTCEWPQDKPTDPESCICIEGESQWGVDTIPQG